MAKCRQILFSRGSGMAEKWRTTENKSETAPHTTSNKKPDLYHIHQPGNRGPEVAKHGQKIRKVQKKLKSPEVELKTIGGAPCKKSKKEFIDFLDSLEKIIFRPWKTNSWFSDFCQRSNGQVPPDPVFTGLRNDRKMTNDRKKNQKLLPTPPRTRNPTYITYITLVTEGQK